jgi:hypothetical protein
MAGGQRGAVAQKADKYALQLFWFPFQRVLSRLLSSRMDTLRARLRRGSPFSEPPWIGALGHRRCFTFNGSLGRTLLAPGARRNQGPQPTR